MKNQKLENGLILLSSLIFYVLFWKETLGLNIFIFSFFMTGLVFSLNPELRFQRPTLLTSAGTILTAILVVWNNSLFSKIVHLFSFTAMAGLAKQKELKLIFYGVFLTIIHFLRIPYVLLQRTFNNRSEQAIKLAPVWRSLRLSILPILIILVFYGIYSFSNVHFRRVSINFWQSFGQWVSKELSISQIVFYLSGIIFVSTIILKSNFLFFQRAQSLHQVNLVRTRKSRILYSSSMIALKSAFQSGVGLLYALNALLLVMNFLDIRHVWFASDYNLSPVEFSSMVHDGTNMLIIALVLAMVVISVLFQRNLNFYPRNSTLKILAYCWIFQNTILAISVAIKNYQYIAANGLAYLRIGVLLFLVLVFFGLITLFWKIHEKRTFYYLIHRNGWAAYALFILCSFINWDVYITKYNLSQQTQNPIDYSFLLHDVSDKNLYLLLEHERKNLVPQAWETRLRYGIDRKKEQISSREEHTTWLSWNYADYQNRIAIRDIE